MVAPGPRRMEGPPGKRAVLRCLDRARIGYDSLPDYLRHGATSDPGPTAWQAVLAAAGPALAFYLFKAVLPVGLLPIYPPFGLNGPIPWKALAWCAVIGGLFLCWIRRASWGRHALFGFGFFFLNLIPVLGIVPMAFLRISLVSDHFAYLPLAGLAGLAAATAGRWRVTARPSVFWVCAVLAIACCAGASRRYARNFASEEDLWTYTLQRNPRAWLAHNNLGIVLAQSGRLGEAIAHGEEAVRLQPISEARSNLGLALTEAHRLPEAIDQLTEAVRLNPNLAGAHLNLGRARGGGPGPKPSPESEKVRGLQPQNPEARKNLAVAHNNLGNALARAGSLPEAVAEFGRALQLDPGNSGTIATWAMPCRRWARAGKRRFSSKRPTGSNATIDPGSARPVSFKPKFLIRAARWAIPGNQEVTFPPPFSKVAASPFGLGRKPCSVSFSRTVRRDHPRSCAIWVMLPEAEACACASSSCSTAVSTVVIAPDPGFRLAFGERLLANSRQRAPGRIRARPNNGPWSRAARAKSSVMAYPCATRSMRFTAFSSCRTLPGHGCAERSFMRRRLHRRHPAKIRAVPAYKITHQRGNVIAPLAQRRHGDDGDIQPVPKILAELPARDHRGRSRCVATTTRTSTEMDSRPPTLVSRAPGAPGGVSPGFRAKDRRSRQERGCRPQPARNARCAGTRRS